ncbi:MAG: helix-turn-helix domain-containing protein [Clostridia bacterium]|nr:helix-turn-helix domain-containing protein [Clostridia bacterium]
MYLDHRVIAKISQVLSQMTMQVMLLDTNGQVIYPEDNQKELTLPEVLLRNPTKPLVYGGYTLIGTENEQPLFICLYGDSSEVQSCAILCVELINTLMRMDMGQGSLEQSLRVVLTGEAETAELEAIAAEHAIPMEKERCVMYFHFSELDAETAMGILKNVISENSDDMVCEVGRHAVALIKAIDDRFEFADMEQLGVALENTFISETSHGALIGISDVRAKLSQLSEAYEEAKSAINVGRIYHPKQQVFVYRKMLLERFLAQIPDDMSEGFHQMMFNRKTARLFNDEMIHTIEKFFENSLNLSETARQLYIHRNTLVYRLDKVQRIIGLDLRAFDDAVTFKLMMLLGKNTNDKKNRI